MWKKRARRGQSGADLEFRRYNSDVEYEEDSKDVENVRASIKVVGRIDYCDGKGPANLESTRYYGCAFENGTFMVALQDLEDLQVRGLVMAHEYGHNVCNGESDEPSEVMYGSAAMHPAGSRRVTPAQCRKYVAPKGSLCRETRGKSRLK